MNARASFDERLALKRYKSYVMGWRDGAGGRPKKPQFTSHVIRVGKAEYDRGYADGEQAQRDAADLYVNVLRSEGVMPQKDDR